MSETIRVLEEDQKPEFARTKALLKQLVAKEKATQAALLKSLEPRNNRIASCVEKCGVTFAESKKHMDAVNAKVTKEAMKKAHFVNFTKEELDKNYVYGWEPVS